MNTRAALPHLRGQGKGPLIWVGSSSTRGGAPADEARVAEYEAVPTAGVADQALKGLAGIEPADADPAEAARQILRVVELPSGKRPFRVHVAPSQDGAEVVDAVADRVRREIHQNIGPADLLSPRINAGKVPVGTIRGREEVQPIAAPSGFFLAVHKAPATRTGQRE